MLRSPQKGETTYQLLKAAWNKLSFFDRAVAIGERLPELVLGLVGLEDWYWASHRKHGWAKWDAPHNLYRQIYHILGGLLIALLGGFYGFALVVVYAAVKEAVDAKRGGEWNKKNTADIAGWLLGATGGLLCL